MKVVGTLKMHTKGQVCSVDICTLQEMAAKVMRKEDISSEEQQKLYSIIGKQPQFSGSPVTKSCTTP